MAGFTTIVTLPFLAIALPTVAFNGEGQVLLFLFGGFANVSAVILVSEGIHQFVR